MTETPQTPDSPGEPSAAPAPAPPRAQAQPRVLRLPSTRASAALAATMLVIGVAVGAAIGPAPQASLASGRLPLLIASLAARAQSQAAAQPSAAAVQPPPVSPQATPATETPSAPASKTPAQQTPSTSTSSTPSTPAPSTPAPTKTGAGQTSTLPPVTSVWFIQLSGTSFTEALAQPAAAPYIDSQLIPAATFLSGWTGLEGSAFASDAALAEHKGDATGAPPILNSIVQPPCPEGAAGAACVQGTPGALTAADDFLKATVPTLTSTASFREHGLIVVTFGEVGNAAETGLPAGASTVTLTSKPPAGVVLLSPFAHAGARSSTPFNPTSPKQSLAKLLH